MALTITEFRARKGADEKLALLTAYDAAAARAVEASGIRRQEHIGWAVPAFAL